MATLTTLQHLRHALFEFIAAPGNALHQLRFQLGQRRTGQLLQRFLQRHLGRLKPFRFAFIFQRPHDLRKAHCRRGDIRRITRKVHAASHVVQRLLLHLFLDLAGMAKPQYGNAANHQRHGHHQQIEEQ